MATHTSLISLYSDIADSIRNKTGINQQIVADTFPTVINGFIYPYIYEVGATTIRKSSSATENYASNNLCQIGGSDNKHYTLAEGNQLFVNNDYSTTGMPEPRGFVLTKHNGGLEGIDGEIFKGQVGNIAGAASTDVDCLQHSSYNTLNCITAAASGTDFTTSKAGSITSDDDNGALYTANTKQTFTIPKGLGYVNAWEDSDNFEERTESLYQINEGYRHRFAIPTTISTTSEDGTITDVKIYNTSGTQAALNEDMYFGVQNDSSDWVNTNLLAKYNLNNLHGGTANHLTTALQDSIYAAQIANGVNMNDTAVNSSAKPLLCPGAKGAEAIAVDGYGYIITPFVTYASNANAISDAPAVYYVKSRNLALTSNEAVDIGYQNKTLITALRTYLVNVEGRTIPALYNGAYGNSARASAASAWYCYTSSGYRYNNLSYFRYHVTGSSAIN